MTIASPSGPTKISINPLILLNPICPCGTNASGKRINGLAGGVPHEAGDSTPAWWLAPCIALGFVVWAYIIGGVV